MFFDELINRGSMPALIATAAFTEARHRVIAENVANLGVPGYKTRQLDPRAFRAALGEALDARGCDPRQPFAIHGRQVRTDERGHLRVTAEVLPPQEVLSHDGTNQSIERQMSDLAKNAMMHELTNTLLKARLDGLRKAIGGRV